MAVGGQCELQDVNHSDAHPGARCGHTLTHLPGANVNNACSGKLVLFGMALVSSCCILSIIAACDSIRLPNTSVVRKTYSGASG